MIVSRCNCQSRIPGLWILHIGSRLSLFEMLKARHINTILLSATTRHSSQRCRHITPFSQSHSSRIKKGCEHYSLQQAILPRSKYRTARQRCPCRPNCPRKTLMCPITVSVPVRMSEVTKEQSEASRLRSSRCASLAIEQTQDAPCSRLQRSKCGRGFREWRALPATLLPAQQYSELSQCELEIPT